MRASAVSAPTAVVVKTNDPVVLIVPPTTGAPGCFAAGTGSPVAKRIVKAGIPAHYPYGLATLGHLGLIYLATAIFVAGALIALKPILRSGKE
jgi:hypothetical protein